MSWQKKVFACFNFTLAGNPYWVDVDWTLKLQTYDGSTLLDRGTWFETDIFAVEKP